MSYHMDRHEKTAFLKTYEDFDPPSDPERTGDDPRYLWALHVWNKAMRYAALHGIPASVSHQINAAFEQQMEDRRAAGNPR